MKILSIDYYDKNAAKDFATSLKETGFAVLKTHPVSWQLIEDIYHEWRNFFNSDAIRKYHYSQEKQDGYFPMDVSEIAKGETVKDIKHYYHLYFPWGRYPEEVSKKAELLFNAMFDLGKTLLQWIDQHMDAKVHSQLPQALTDTLSYEKTLLRILHYPALKGDEEPGAIRAAAHEDINLITLLPTASSPGLEVFSPYDKNWYEVPVHEQSIIVNIGDMLDEMTEGEYIATKHRVVKPEGEASGIDRLSTPCFMHPKEDVYISERYPTAKDFLDERLRQLGVKV
ncbi:isopenicillin N synthase family oxygenase [Thiotrichales bacterium 19S3-7]|nr:isopenicillin N synthase family oxygenase [Thiotrichales bacterium 19S3-7]MCF6801641.1 isopenicillin N synthase family oxygenase [Thiotrichales bacterium 19S3-11]